MKIICVVRRCLTKLRISDRYYFIINYDEKNDIEYVI